MFLALIRYRCFMIDLVSLQALVALGRHGSVAGAAAVLGYTPSAISQQIKRLERDTGVTLLERVGRGVVLTEPARLLVDDARRLFGQLESISARLELAGSTPSGALRLACFATSLRGLVAPLAAELARDLPALTLTVIEKDPADAVEMVAGGQADLAVVHDWTGVPVHRPAHVQGRQIGTDRVDVLLPAHHRLAGADQVVPQQLTADLWASTPVGSICHEWFTLMFAGQDQLPRIRFWAWEYASQIELVRQGVAVAMLPRLGRPPLPDGVVAVPVVDPSPTRHLHVLWRDTMAHSPSVQDITARLARLAST